MLQKTLSLIKWETSTENIVCTISNTTYQQSGDKNIINNQQWIIIKTLIKTPFYPLWKTLVMKKLKKELIIL